MRGTQSTHRKSRQESNHSSRMSQHKDTQKPPMPITSRSVQKIAANEIQSSTVKAKTMGLLIQDKPRDDSESRDINPMRISTITEEQDGEGVQHSSQRYNRSQNRFSPAKVDRKEMLRHHLHLKQN